jgi:HlyD family secretion protein
MNGESKMSDSFLPRRRNLLRSRWLWIGLILLAAAGGAIYVLGRSGNAAAAPRQDTVVVTRGTLVSSITGSGTIAAEQSLDLAFQGAGTVTAVPVSAGDTVSAGQTLVQLDDRALRIQIANAQAGLTIAQARLQQTQQGAARPEDITAAQASVKSTQASYDDAVQTAGFSSSQLEALKADLEKANVALQAAQSDYDRVSWRSDIGMLPQSHALQNATIDYWQAKANYDALNQTAGADNTSRIESAAAQLEQAKANLAKLTAPALDTDMAIQHGMVAQAQQALAQAELSLEAASIKAPFSGVVVAVNVTPGSQIAAGTVAVTLIDRSTLHVDLKLNENDAARALVSQPVTLTIDSLAGWRAPGKVTYVAPAAAVVNGVVTYAVRVSFADADPRVKVGMTTNVNIVTARKENVLLVPNSALAPQGDGHAVQMPGADGKAQDLTVETGLTDGVETEIVSGLHEGDRILAVPQLKKQGSGLFGGG